MDYETGFFYQSMTWGIPLVWIAGAIFAFRNGKRVSGWLIVFSAFTAILESILFYEGYALPTDWQTKAEAFSIAEMIGWFAQHVLPVLGFISLFAGYIVAVRKA
jgi:hypothetical protein